MITPQNPSSLSASDITRGLFRHSKKAIAVCLLIVMATVCWILFAPAEYKSSSKVYVRVGRESNTLDPSATTGQTVEIKQTLESEINSMLQILESRETARRVVSEVGIDTILANDLPDGGSGEPGTDGTSALGKLKSFIGNLKSSVLPQKFAESDESRAIRMVLNRSNFWAPKNSNVIEISCRAGHPKLAQMITKSWTDAFIEEHLRVTKTEGSLFFFVHQAEQLREQLSTAEEDLKEAKSSSNLVSIEGQRQILEDQSNSIRTRALTNDALLESSKAKIKELKSILEVVPARSESDLTTADSSEGWYGLRERLFDLQIREHELKSRYSAENPEVIAVLQQRAAIEKILAEQSKSSSESISSPNPTYRLFQQSLLNEQAQVVALMAESNSLQKQRQSNLEEIKKLNESALQIGDLERQRLILENSYIASSARMEQAKTLQGLEQAKISSLNELQTASYNTRPVGMGRLSTLLLGIFLGLFAGLAVAGTAEYFDRSFVTASQVEESLELPVLVSIPKNRRQLVEVS